jgi:UrcA family protein
MQRICHPQRPSYEFDKHLVDEEEQDMNSISNRISIGSAAFVTAMLLATGNAGAADRTATSADIAIKFSEVQINNEADAETLYKKVKSAARAVCDDNAGGHRTLEVRTRTEKCVNQVLADAVRRINQPMLTALHETKTGKTSNEG